jgi:hypothetical protein
VKHRAPISKPETSHPGDLADKVKMEFLAGSKLAPGEVAIVFYRRAGTRFGPG